MMNKITMDMTGLQVITVLADGNVGAVSVLASVARDSDKHDPDAFGWLGTALALDDLGLYGSRIWQLYKDVCGQKVGTMLAVLRARQLGILSERVLLDHVGDDERRGKPFDNIAEIIAKVQAELPNFKLEVAS